MKTLCTCAALAVATAFAHGHFADARLRSNGISQRNGTIEDNNLAKTVDCLAKINAFRNSLLSGGEAQPYEKIDDVSDGEGTAKDLTTFLHKQTCEGLQNGEFEHIADGDSAKKIFVITAKKNPSREDAACDVALAQWKSGFSAFNGEYPPKYKDFSTGEKSANPYANGDAAALVSLLHKEPQKVICGTMTSCTSEVELLCYFKPSAIEEGRDTVDPELWRGLEVDQKHKPKLEDKTAETDGDYSLKAVNDARAAVGLTNQFNAPSKGRSRRSAETIEQAVQEFLYTLTCDDIVTSNISPAPSDKFTVIYYIKDGDSAPTMAEAVAHWESGFEKLEYKRPPAFKKEALQPKTDSATEDPAVEASKIYSDSTVAGYVSIMTDASHTMSCVAATGCKKPQTDLKKSDAESSPKSGLVCVVSTATLKDGEQPISKATWAKIMAEKGYPLPEFKQLEASKNCLEEMNAVRTQEKLGLKPFLVKEETAKSGTDLVLSGLMESVTCPAIGGAASETAKTTGPKFTVTDGTTSLMYHTGTENTCSEAVEAWKKGSEKFTAAPPEYKSEETVYKDSAATNFVSLISEGEKTVATCYSTNCEKGGIVCELSPAALVEGRKPVSEATWTKYKESAESSGVTGVSKAALFGTVVMALAAGVFFL